MSVGCLPVHRWKLALFTGGKLFDDYFAVNEFVMLYLMSYFVLTIIQAVKIY